MATTSRQQRQQLRRRLGRLEVNLVRKFTVERYNEAFNLFTEHLSQLGRAWPVSPEEYDLVVSEYLELLWDSGEPKSMAAYTLAALLYFIPPLKKRLPRSWKLKATWDKLELPCQAIPLDLDTLFAFVGYFLRQQEHSVALGCIIAFNGLLRTGELLDLKAADCYRSNEGFVLVLNQTKGGQRRLLQDESVIISDHLTIWAIEKLLQGKMPGDFLVSLSPAAFRTKWNAMKAHLGLQDFRFLPYSLRRGGATWYFRCTGSFSQTMNRGRWQHLKTCKLYIAEAQTTMASISLPLATQAKLADLCRSVRPHLSRWASRVRVEEPP